MAEVEEELLNMGEEVNEELEHMVDGVDEDEELNEDLEKDLDGITLEVHCK